MWLIMIEKKKKTFIPTLKYATLIRRFFDVVNSNVEIHNVVSTLI